MKQPFTDKKNELKRRVLGMIFVLTEEQQMRCGDGTGKITSHSMNCNCDKIQFAKRYLDELLALLDK